MALDRDNARLLAAAGELSGDEHVSREAEDWRDVSPEERLVATLGLAGLAAHQLGGRPDDERARAEEPDPLPADALAILQRMWQAARE